MKHQTEPKTPKPQNPKTPKVRNSYFVKFIYWDLNMVESENKSQRNASPNRLDKTEFAWQSQDDFMKNLENEPLDNPLVYEKIPYYSREWDNIPPIVPRYVI